MRALQARLRDLVTELGQRRVYQAVALYAAGVFVILQAADLVIEGLALPPWLLTFLILLAACGLPVVVVLAWAFDLTPPGIRRADAEQEPGGRVRSSRGVVGLAVVLIVAGAAGFAVWARVGTRPGSPGPSVAVLPFVDLGGDADEEYLRDGLTEDVLTQLAKAGGLRVISRTSVMQYKGSQKPLRVIGAELGVTHVLEGSVRRTGDQVRISAQLIDARTDRHVWAETYDRRSTDWLEVQADIARRIARALRVRLTDEELARIEAPTADPEAYDLYLRARQYLYRYEREANEIAIELARKALHEDPELAPAQALLGTAFAFKVRLGEGPEWGDSALVASQRAIALDPQLSEGHLALGNSYLRLGRYPEALQAYERASTLNPSDWRAAANTAVVYSYQGQPVEALRWTRRAITMDPRSPLTGVAYRNMAGYYIDLCLPGPAGEALGVARRTTPPDHPQIRTMEIGVALQRGLYGRARALADSLSTEAPTDASAHLIAGDAFLFSENLDGARLHYERAYALSPAAEGVRHYAPALLGHVLWRQGERARAERLFAEFDELARKEMSKGHDNYTMHLSLAGVAATRGDSEEALLYLQRAIASGGVSLEWGVTHDPLLAGIRDDVRFQSLRTGLRARAEAMRRQALLDRSGTGGPRASPREARTAGACAAA